jgi:hypothetical protein
VVTRDFNDLRHVENYIAYIGRTRGYEVSEVWYNRGELFAEGDTFYHIEDVDGRRVVREATWVSGDTTGYDFITSSRDEAQQTADIINK